jgi:hypothetical protein
VEENQSNSFERRKVMALNKNAKKWVAALRSRKYKQTTGALRRGNTFCCLGVACELAVKAGVIPPAKNESYAGHDANLPGEVVKWLGLANSEGDFTERNGTLNCLMNLNDAEKKKFYQIARVIERQPKGLFAK